MATVSKAWLTEEGALLDYTETATAPCKDFYHVFVTPYQMIFRFWRIVPPTRTDSKSDPVEISNTYDDFLHDERCHTGAPIHVLLEFLLLVLCTIIFPSHWLPSHINITETKIRGEIQRLAGDNTLKYLTRIAEGYIDYLPRLPDNVLKHIILYLELEDLVRLGSTSRKFRHLCNSDDVWEKIFRRELGTPVTAELEQLALKEGWKRLFYTNKLQLQMQLRRQRRQDHAFVTQEQQMDY